MQHHILQLYEDEAALVGRVAAFLREGAAQGEGLVLATTPAHRAALAPLLPPDTWWLDASETLASIMRDGHPDPARFEAVVGAAVRRAAQGGRRVRAFGEMVALLWERGEPDAAWELERLWNTLGATVPLALLCAYPLKGLGANGAAASAAFDRIAAAHGETRPAELPHDEAGRAAYVARLQRQAEALAGEAALRRQAEAELALADRRKDDFIAMLAHELRNPLVPILMATELVRRNRHDPDRVLDWAATIERQATQMRRLVEDLLDVSRINSGRIALQQGPVHLLQVVETATEQARPLLEARGHAFARDLPPEHVTLHGDGARLAQMLGNLLHNAAKYTPHGGRVTLRARLEPTEAGRDLVLEVSDSGIGIPEAMRDAIFEPFVQAARAPDHSPGGLGVGLTVVRRIAELHGGAVAAESAGPGQGSTFRVRIPLPRPAPPPRPAEPSRATPRRRILVVDDNPDVAASLRAYLEAEGHEVRTHGDGPSALAAAVAEPPEVAILDIGMPGMDGHELARRMRAACPAVELVALSGYAQAADRERSRAAGFHHHLAKPPDLRRLRGILVPKVQA